MSCAALASVAGGIDVSTLLTGVLNLQADLMKATEEKQREVRRKRRRGEVANPANTLDALVARKADDCTQPFEKRYLSEQEAIEGPDDEIEMKKMEHDPDVSTRTCSTCGYQGKWVSEMIRHKRVHTSERPFKCRYCSRTSKWKADLIRHVAKTHGIRVVSKYSRSKTFDSSTIFNKSFNESEGHESEPDNVGKSSSSSSDVEMPMTKEKRGSGGVQYRCVTCGFQDERVSVLTQHVRRLHDTSPYVCRCGAQFDDIQSALAHANRSCTSYDIVFNVIPNYIHEKASLSPCESDLSSDSGVQMEVDESEPIDLMTRALPNLYPLFSPIHLQTPLLSPALIESPLLHSPFDLQTALLALQSPLGPYLASISSLLASPTTMLNLPSCTPSEAGSDAKVGDETEDVDVEK